MPVTYLNVTDIAHDDQRMKDQLLSETGRKVVLDPDWRTPTASGKGHCIFLYDSEIDYILITTDCKVEFRRVVPIDSEAVLACIGWDNRSGEQYYIFRVDPAQKVIIAGSPTVRFFRRPNKREQASVSEKSESKPHAWTPERLVRPWEAGLAEAALRFKAWRAVATKRLFTYMMVSKHLHEAEWVQLLESEFHFFDDVPWVL